jgi:hypothetical protein
MRRAVKFIALISGVLVIGLAVAAFFAYRALVYVPDWYQEALAATGDEAEAGDVMEQKLLALTSDLKKEEQWEAIFSDDQINGWLATQLIEKFPQWLPQGAENPRVFIGNDHVLVGCQYTRGGVTTVLNTSAEVYLTEEPNVMAVRIDAPKAGALPLPIKGLLEELSATARERGLQLRWAEEDGDPVALITLPDRQKDTKGRLRVETIDVRDGEVFLSGQTVKETSDGSSG